MYDDIARHLVECDAKVQILLRALGQRDVNLGKAPRTGSKQREEFDARQIIANWAGFDLTRINGLGLTAVMKILSELGPDLSRFATVKHFLFVAWTVFRDQDQRRQGPLRQHEALGQSGTSDAKNGRDEPVAQRLGTRCILSSLVQPDGQAQRQHCHGAQTRTHGVFHAHPWRKLR